MMFAYLCRDSSVMFVCLDCDECFLKTNKKPKKDAPCVPKAPFKPAVVVPNKTFAHYGHLNANRSSLSPPLLGRRKNAIKEL
jgi:hypothetical protein